MAPTATAGQDSQLLVEYIEKTTVTVTGEADDWSPPSKDLVLDRSPDPDPSKNWHRFTRRRGREQGRISQVKQHR